MTFISYALVCMCHTRNSRANWTVIKRQCEGEYLTKELATIIRTIDFFGFCLILNGVIYCIVLEVHRSKMEHFIQLENGMWLESELECIWMEEVYVN